MHPSVCAGLIPWGTPVGVLLLRGHLGGCAQGWQPLHKPCLPVGSQTGLQGKLQQCHHLTQCQRRDGAGQSLLSTAVPQLYPDLCTALGCLCGQPEWVGEPWPRGEAATEAGSWSGLV